LDFDNDDGDDEDIQVQSMEDAVHDYIESHDENFTTEGDDIHHESDEDLRSFNNNTVNVENVVLEEYDVIEGDITDRGYKLRPRKRGDYSYGNRQSYDTRLLQDVVIYTFSCL